MIDDVDRQLLALLQADARVSNAELARQVGMAPSATLERVRRLEERGIITGYSANLNPKSLGLGLIAFVFVRADERVGEMKTANQLAEIPEVLEVHHIAGEDCFLVKLRTTDTEALGSLLRDRFGTIPAIRSTRTTIVLQTVKETGNITLPGNKKGDRTRGTE